MSDRWNARYIEDDTPWDTLTPEAVLLETLDEIGLNSGLALDFGCGRGTNAIAMAQRGLRVVATDLAPEAIEQARNRATEQGIESEIEFRVHDITCGPVAAPNDAGFDIVFDRGCFHSIDEYDRAAVADHVARSLAPGGWWLTLCGNADEVTEHGPPRVSAAHLAEVIEPRFEIHRLQRGRFSAGTGHDQQPPLKWALLAMRR